MRSKKRKRKNVRIIFAASVVIALTVLFWYRAERAIRPIAEKKAEEFAKRSAYEAVSSTVADYLDSGRCTYKDFAAIIYDEQGRAVSIEAVPYNINKVQAELSREINKKFHTTEGETAEIPLGTLSGKYLLSGKGPSLKLKICPADEAEVKLVSDFCTAGINQTKHRISAVITATVKSSMPIYSFSTEVSFEFLLAENVIIGEVPQLSRYTWSEMK